MFKFSNLYKNRIGVFDIFNFALKLTTDLNVTNMVNLALMVEGRGLNVPALKTIRALCSN